MKRVLLGITLRDLKTNEWIGGQTRMDVLHTVIKAK